MTVTGGSGHVMPHSILFPPSTDLDGATEPGDPAAMSSTPGEFAARWNAGTEEQREKFMHHLAENDALAQRWRRCHGGL